MNVQPRHNSAYTWKGESEDEGRELVDGVLIVGFRPGSCAREAGMQKGDVIVAYAGVGDLTTEKLAGLADPESRQGTPRRVVYVRGGHERSTTVAPGSLGVSVMDRRRHYFSEPHEPEGRIERINIIIFWVEKICMVTAIFLLIGGLLIPNSWPGAVVVVAVVLYAAGRLTGLCFAIGLSVRDRQIGSLVGLFMGLGVGYAISRAL